MQILTATNGLKTFFRLIEAMKSSRQTFVLHMSWICCLLVKRLRLHVGLITSTVFITLRTYLVVTGRGMSAVRSALKGSTFSFSIQARRPLCGAVVSALDCSRPSMRLSLLSMLVNLATTSLLNVSCCVLMTVSIQERRVRISAMMVLSLGSADCGCDAHDVDGETAEG